MLDIYISPCPNDTYMFHSLCKGIRKISVPLRFHYLDIAELNQKVLNGIPGVFKLSFATLFQVEDNYQMLNSGAALGYGCGPLLLRRPGLLQTSLVGTSRWYSTVQSVHLLVIISRWRVVFK